MNELILLLDSILPLSDDDKSLIKQYTSLNTIKKGEEYGLKGSVSNKMGFVVDGVFKVVRINSKGNDFIPYFINEGHFVIDLDSFLNRSPSEEYIEALTTCKVITMTKSSFDFLENEVSNFSKIMGKLKENALIEKHKLKSEMLADDAATRYAKFIQRQPSIIQRVSQNHIAQFLGITPYTLSRIRKNH